MMKNQIKYSEQIIEKTGIILTIAMSMKENISHLHCDT